MGREYNDRLRYGSLLVFKPGIDSQKARNALKQIQHLLEQPSKVEKFDPQQGWPVFYIP